MAEEVTQEEKVQLKAYPSLGRDWTAMSGGADHIIQKAEIIQKSKFYRGIQVKQDVSQNVDVRAIIQ